MAVFLALGKTLGDDAIPIIYSFLDDSSVVATCGSGATDAADLSSLEHLNWADDFILRINQSLSNVLLNVDTSEAYWHLDG